jgi:N-acetylmuramoyl-L-alanine amidase
VEKTYLFANILLDDIQELGINRRGVRPGNWFVIREHNLPGVLVENGFHTNPYDRALLSSNYFLQSLAVVYRDAVMRYFGYVG